MIASLRLAGLLGWQDVRQAYRRSAIGPFWLTLGMAVQIATIGLVFGLLFKTPMQEYLPFLSTGIVLWGFVSAVLSESCNAFINGEAIIKQLNIPLFVHNFRVVWKALVTFAHNVVILPIAFLAVGSFLQATSFLAIPGLALLVVNVSWLAVILAYLTTRYRDIAPIVASFLTVAFYLTPVMWQPNSLGEGGLQNLLLQLNPFYHLIQLVREPLLGNLPTVENWLVSLALALLGWCLALIVQRKYSSRIPYWV